MNRKTQNLLKMKASICGLLVLMTSFCALAQRQEFIVVLKNHLFYPAEIIIPPNQKVKLIIDNQDNSIEEFDSFTLNREKVLFPQQKSVIYIGPLSPGHYEFFGEYNPHSARGLVIVNSDNADHSYKKEDGDAN